VLCTTVVITDYLVNPQASRITHKDVLGYDGGCVGAFSNVNDYSFFNVVDHNFQFIHLSKKYITNLYRMEEGQVLFIRSEKSKV
jgi:hypothetical protein